MTDRRWSMSFRASARNLASSFVRPVIAARKHQRKILAVARNNPTHPTIRPIRPIAAPGRAPPIASISTANLRRSRVGSTFETSAIRSPRSTNANPVKRAISSQSRCTLPVSRQSRRTGNANQQPGRSHRVLHVESRKQGGARARRENRRPPSTRPVSSPTPAPIAIRNGSGLEGPGPVFSST